MMKAQTCCFTGHRIIPPNEYEGIQKRLEGEIINLIHQGVRYFGAGGALGFDTMAALAVLKLKSEFSHVRLILVLPCEDQTIRWDEEDIKTHRNIFSKADKVVYVSKKYHGGCMHKRNRHLVKHSRFCICYFNDSKGGTAHAVHCAKQKGLRIINLVNLVN